MSKLSFVSDDGTFRIWAIEPYITSLDGGNTATHLIEENYKADNQFSPGSTHTYWLGIGGNTADKQWVNDYPQESLAQVCETLGIEVKP